jgi:hypothetical protein
MGNFGSSQGFMLANTRSAPIRFGIGAGPAEVMRITPSGDLGIGTTNPGAKLEVAGQVKITGGSPGAGKVLTSDATGLATWQTPSVPVNFRATMSANQATVAGAYTTVNFNTVAYNNNGTFTASQFTAPSAGLYHFDLRCNFLAGTPGTQVVVYLWYGVSGWETTYGYLTTGGLTVPVSTDAYLNAGDVVYAQVWSSAAVTLVGSTGNTSFTGHKVN